MFVRTEIHYLTSFPLFPFHIAMASKKSTKPRLSLRPLTVLQCARATQLEKDGNWFLDGDQLDHVSIPLLSTYFII